MKNSADQGGCYPQRAKAEVDNTLRDLQNSSYPTQPPSIIAKYKLKNLEKNLAFIIFTLFIHSFLLLLLLIIIISLVQLVLKITCKN